MSPNLIGKPDQFLKLLSKGVHLYHKILIFQVSPIFQVKIKLSLKFSWSQNHENVINSILFYSILFYRINVFLSLSFFAFATYADCASILSPKVHDVSLKDTKSKWSKFGPSFSTKLLNNSQTTRNNGREEIYFNYSTFEVF